MSERNKEPSFLFEPVNKAHAIVEMVIFCQFVPEFDNATIDRLMTLGEDLKDELPRSERIQTGIVQTHDQENASFRTKETGVDLRRFKADGEPEWVLRTNANAISVHCLDYTRWDDVGMKGKRFLQAALHKVGTTESALAVLGLKYVDRFAYNGTEQRYDPTLLFQQDTPLLTKQAFEAKMQWHCHSGWFEELDNFEELKCLNQVNVDAAFLSVSGVRHHITTITHNAAIKGEKADDLADFLAHDEGEVTILNQLIDTLHLVNKRVLIDLLTDEMATRINLSQG